LWQNILRDSRFYEALLQFDRDLGESVRSAGCVCGGRLHRADYARKPRGIPKGVAGGSLFAQRISFCCDREGCRRRNTPASVRFFGRRFYLSTVVVLVSVMLHGVTPKRSVELRAVFDVPLRTIERWRVWWRTLFSEGPFWKVVRARFSPSVDTRQLPLSLCERFRGDDEFMRGVDILAFLSPITVPGAT